MAMASSFGTHIFAFFSIQTSSVFGIWTPHSQRIYLRELILILVCLTLTRRCTLFVVFYQPTTLINQLLRLII